MSRSEVSRARSRNRQWQKPIRGPNQLINHIKQVLLLKKTTYQYHINKQNTTHVQSVVLSSSAQGSKCANKFPINGGMKLAVASMRANANLVCFGQHSIPNNPEHVHRLQTHQNHPRNLWKHLNIVLGNHTRIIPLAMFPNANTISCTFTIGRSSIFHPFSLNNCEFTDKSPKRGLTNDNTRLVWWSGVLDVRQVKMPAVELRVEIGATNEFTKNISFAFFAFWHFNGYGEKVAYVEGWGFSLINK